MSKNIMQKFIPPRYKITDYKKDLPKHTKKEVLP